jgi:riboflavin synthase
MFTGLVQAVGTVAETQKTATGTRLVIDPAPWPYKPALGDSISVSGCCLTVAALDPRGRWAFDAIPETLAKTTLGTFRPGTKVNLEHAATPTTLLGGHIVQGHIDGLGRVESVETGNEYRLRIKPPAALMEFVSPKGSICVDGVSLTIAALSPTEGWFEVALIPTTLEKTTLATLRSGGPCNLEADAMSKTIVHWLKHYGPK